MDEKPEAHTQTRVAVRMMQDESDIGAANRGAVEIQVHATSGIEISRTDRFLRHAGFRQVGGNYSLAVGAGRQAL